MTDAHRLADQWRLECKKAKELGQKPPLPPQEQKRLAARKAKKEAAESEGLGKGGGAGSKGGGGPGSKDSAILVTGREATVETDSSEDERNAAEVCSRHDLQREL